jgi:SET domain-containing protein
MAKEKLITFELKQSKVHGVGVFSTEYIKRGTKLPLFDDEEPRYIKFKDIEKFGIPFKIIKKHSIYDEERDMYIGPQNYNKMAVGWFLNHSKSPNAMPDADYEYYSVRAIKPNEEITIDYNEL